MNVFQQHFTCFSQVFVNLDRVKISQIRSKLDIHKRIGQYLLSDSCSNKESDTREFGLSHSCAASQLAVGFGGSVPLCGTYGEMRDGYVMYVLHCVMCEMRSVLKGHVYMKPTASCEAAQLWVRTNFPSYPIVPRRGDVWLFVGEEVLVNRQPTLYVYIL